MTAVKLALLDRDGVVVAEQSGFVTGVDQIELIAGSAEAIARLNEAGVKTALITNQSAVGRGLISVGELAQIHARLAQHLAEHNAHLDAIFACTDPPWAPTARRKPNPGMVWEATGTFNTNPRDGVMIGDDLRDLEAAATAGCGSILVRTGKGRSIETRGLPQHVAPLAIRDDLAAAVDYLLEHGR